MQPQPHNIAPHRNQQRTTRADWLGNRAPWAASQRQAMENDADAAMADVNDPSSEAHYANYLAHQRPKDEYGSWLGLFLALTLILTFAFADQVAY